MTVKFAKVESIGNDFPLFHDEDVAGLDLPQLAVQTCDRRFGIGGDGMLVLGLSDDKLSLRMFNPDGSEDFCGNGLRCAAMHAHSLGWVGDEFEILHGGESVPVRILSDGVIETTLEPADYTPEKVPQTGETLYNEVVWAGLVDGDPYCLFGSALTTGSTHVVIPTAALPEDEAFRTISSRIERDIRFPNRTSVMWSQETGPDEISIRIWERGAGETLGCGTGSSAAAVDYLRRRGRGGTVQVKNPGGTLSIRLDAWNAPIVVQGTPKALYTGEYRVKIP